MRIRCRFGWHDWGQWRPTRVRHTQFGVTVGWGWGQYRACRHCRIERVR